MEFEIQAKDGALPCEVIIDEDNGRYMLRDADTTGEVFNDPYQLKAWIEANWHAGRFEDPDQFQQLLQELKAYS
ncbi:hypothetical protein NC661_03635 [Aquibacillus koreensis]|uniref:Threonine dehydratase n=1 Tax=Aquibacillus koreensis TaxID=279446 RepID=A0A9X4AH87_9BACI|nr:hypothetical protein [Aquibacillus koreensis]MCT2536458.1 hypothetical protein [Aquibacillus koreensis]MDC3419454.1 hypothetical protein [Aquibacillus koreensis]